MHQFNFLFSPMAQALGTTLLHSLWQAFIIFLFLKIVLRLMPDTTSKFRYQILCLSYMIITVWFIATFLGQLDISIRWSGPLLKEIAHQSGIDGILLPSHTAQLTEDLPFSIVDNYVPWLTAFYLIGIVWFALKLMLSYLQTIRLRTEGLSEMDSAFMDQLGLLARGMNIRKPVYAYVSEKILSPVMIGFFRPMILLPMAAINNLSPQQLQAILLHELAHIRRNDYLINLLQTVMDILLFFNPFVYQISKNIRIEREKCCDEMALRSSDPCKYANALLTLEESTRRSHRLAMGSNKNPSQLLNRIKNIMEMKNKHTSLKQKLIALAIVVLATASIAWLTPGENKVSGNIDAQHILKMNSSGTKTETDSGILKPTASFRVMKDTNNPRVIPLASPMPPAPPVSPASTLPPAPPAAPVLLIPPMPPTPEIGSVMETTDSVPGISNYFKGPEWEKQMEAIRQSTEGMKKYFQSEDWKNQQNEIQKSTAQINRYLTSPEWKNQMEAIHKNTGAIKEYINSPEKQHSDSRIFQQC